ncbi:AI-2E family transporter [Halorubellus sp. JP-L1]|uniref:AI-2E family transporter n=1 Tax=Halorubellus sp. JP-L1 TaxID=2715753 RepID=UPI00140DEDD1|nr:AI-2E family transporter [Halorubellus sp. JP-L1]NHN43141.1 AI-2E family transporter [Halorubellus sp. JP-L1]
MSWLDDRRHRLGLAAIVVSIVSLYVLWQIVWTVFFALTFVYVLYPWREELVDRGLHPRAAAGVLTAVAFAGVVGLFVPVLLVVYQRRKPILDFLRNLPQTMEMSFAGFTYAIELQSLVPVVRNALSSFAVAATSAAPELAMKVFLFVFLVYAVLYRPGGVRSLVFAVVDGPVQEELTAYHERVRETLYGLYFVQAATGVLTFVLALAVFGIIGYDAFFSLAVVAGILQFIPVIGPSVLVVALAAVEVANGNVAEAVLVLVLGFTLIGFLPDAILRPRLAKYSAGMPASLYFVGFIGGVFTIGPIGIIAGPLALSLLVETFELVAYGVEKRESLPLEAGDPRPDESEPDVSGDDENAGDPPVDPESGDPVSDGGDASD